MLHYPHWYYLLREATDRAFIFTPEAFSMSSTEPAKPPAAAVAAGPAPAPAAASAPTKTITATTKSKSATSKSKAKTATKAGGGTQAKAKKPARKKKPASKSSSSAASTQAILNNARAAQIDLAKQKAQAAARKSDPLWYRIEDVLPVIREANAMTKSPPSILPEQVQIVETALGLCGLTRADVTPQAMACLLEQARRFAQELIANAQDYAHAASRAEITRADLLLAKEMRADHKIAISTQLPKLNLIAQHVNKAPLPPIPPQCYSGVLLPPKSHQLTARTYDIVSGAQVTQRKMVQTLPEAPHKKTVVAAAPSQTASYGATRAGHQIPIKLKSTAVTTTTAAVAPTSTSAPIPMDISSPAGVGAATAPAPTTMTGTTTITTTTTQPSGATAGTLMGGPASSGLGNAPPKAGP